MKLVITGWLIFLVLFPSQAEVFVETFNDKNLMDWQEVNMQDIGLAIWDVIDGELHGINRNPLMSLLVIKDKIWHDYSVEFEVNPLKKHGFSNIIIAVRMQKNWGVLCIIGNVVPGDASSVACLSGDINGNFILLGQKPHKFLRLNQWSTLKLSVNGNVPTFYINGKEVLDPMVLEPVDGFPEFIKGSAGFGLTACEAKFDNISIRELNNLSVMLGAKLTTTWGNLKRF